MTRYVSFYSSVYGLLLMYATMACGQSLTVDKAEIRFVGSACKNLSPDQVSFQGKRMIIDLSLMEPLNRLQTRSSCLIKIPYRGGKGRTTLSLDGQYNLNPDDILALSWRFDPTGTLGPAKILSLSETTQGRISWQESMDFDEEAAQADTGLLRISLYMDWKKAASAIGVQPRLATNGRQKRNINDRDRSGEINSDADAGQSPQPLILKSLSMSSVDACQKPSSPSD